MTKIFEKFKVVIPSNQQIKEVVPLAKPLKDNFIYLDKSLANDFARLQLYMDSYKKIYNTNDKIATKIGINYLNNNNGILNWIFILRKIGN